MHKITGRVFVTVISLAGSVASIYALVDKTQLLVGVAIGKAGYVFILACCSGVAVAVNWQLWGTIRDRLSPRKRFKRLRYAASSHRHAIEGAARFRSPVEEIRLDNSEMRDRYVLASRLRQLGIGTPAGDAPPDEWVNFLVNIEIFCETGDLAAARRFAAKYSD